MRERLQDHALWLVVSRWLRLGSLLSGWRRRLTRSPCLPAQAARRRPARTALRYRRASTADINGPCRICRPVGVAFKSSSGCVASAVVKPTVPGACSRSALSQRSPLRFQDGRNGWKGSCIISAWHWVGAPLPDREAATVATWLAEHPSITIIARDPNRGTKHQAEVSQGSDVWSCQPRPTPSTPSRRRMIPRPNLHQK